MGTLKTEKEASGAWRREVKYLISDSEAEVLKKRFSFLLRTDPHAEVRQGYFVRSLYFDDDQLSAYDQKIAGTDYRKKYRIRIYNMRDDVIMLERKRKEGDGIQKVSAPLTVPDLNRILQGDYECLLSGEDRLYRDFYADLRSCRLHPVVTVDYERIPFVSPYGDVRLTIDSRIRCLEAAGSLFDGGKPSYEVSDPGTRILEVKYTQYLPDMIRDLLQIGSCVEIAASKYVMSLQKMRRLTSAQGFTEG